MEKEKPKIDELKAELSQLEQNYAQAFEAEESPHFLNTIWKKIKELQMKIENQETCN